MDDFWFNFILFMIFFFVPPFVIFCLFMEKNPKQLFKWLRSLIGEKPKTNKDIIDKENDISDTSVNTNEEDGEERYFQQFPAQVYATWKMQKIIEKYGDNISPVDYEIKKTVIGTDLQLIEICEKLEKIRSHEELNKIQAQVLDDNTRELDKNKIKRDEG